MSGYGLKPHNKPRKFRRHEQRPGKAKVTPVNKSTKPKYDPAHMKVHVCIAGKVYGNRDAVDLSCTLCNWSGHYELPVIPWDEYKLHPCPSDKVGSI